MKILHVLNEFREIGNGIVNVATDLACFQARAGHQVLVASSGGEYVDLLKAYGGHHVYFDQQRNTKNLIKATKLWQEIVEEFKPDVVHAHMMTGAVIARLTRKKNSYKIVTTVHNEFQKSADLMRLGDRVVAVSENVKDAMIRRGIDRGKLRVILNGTIGSPRRKSLQEITPVDLNHPAIVVVGAVLKRKGSDIIIEAFKNLSSRFPNAHLYFVGGLDWQIARTLANNTGVGSKIHFVGFDPQPQRYMLSADIFAFPTLKESFGLVLIEAREMGLPIVASNVGGIPEALSHGQAGILVPPADPTALAFELEKLLESPEYRMEMSTKAYQDLDIFTVERMNYEYLELYKDITSI
ncbi:glycosyltransferase family 4 protein [Deinococcus gobiensis]|uniref:Glycosyl transferase, group 1 n=1 Tax=Deinococcus gobiensis (strain DSM 21396 / JCM 16679 / CGMCC 1.7299 / I-0) TaxID=745776 RepID=H8H084_DEIGI|nr:glycosyltransferase family 4 protein [Deinococcus gobiensis]AFD27136.1 Glycosyl transferase, group 1 [Deinococcus gobiensis I-0]